MNSFWTKIDKPFTCLAPLAGYTDQPMRLMAKKYGVDVTYSEMVSSEALWHNAITKKTDSLIKTLDLIRFSKTERPYVVQLFGSDPEKMAVSAEYIVSGRWYEDYRELNSNYKTKNFNQTRKLNIKSDNDLETLNLVQDDNVIPDGIDINMGCPVRDVVKTGSGSALIKNQDNAQDIVRSIKKKIGNIPVSVKTRLGWDNKDDILEFSKKIEDSGADALAIHGRTYKQAFSGEADWENIYKVKKQLSIPVIGNGDIDQLTIKNFKLKTKLDGVMIGRGALGKPWIFDFVKNRVSSQGDEERRGDLEIASQVRNDSREFIIKNLLEHADLMQKLKGERSILEFRKHISWYLRGFDGASVLRKKLVRVDSFEDIHKRLKNMV